MDGDNFIKGGATFFSGGMLLFALHFIFGGQSNFFIFGIILMALGVAIAVIGAIINNI